MGAVLRLRPRRRARGVTLVELLIVIAIALVLVALAIPMLRGVRSQSAGARSLSTIRQLLAGLELYTGGNRETFPYFATPGDPYGPFTIRGHVIRSPRGYFMEHSFLWPSVLIPEYFDGPRQAVESRAAREGLKERGMPDFIIGTHFLLSATTAAAPSYWSESDETKWDLRYPPDTLLRATRQSEVLFPASKGLLLDVMGGAFAALPDGFETGAYHIGCADGGARDLPVAQHDRTRVVIRPHGAFHVVVISTRDGLHGRDF